MKNNIEFYYRQWCKIYAIAPKPIKEIKDDGVFAKLIGLDNILLYARKHPVDVTNMQKGFERNVIK